MKAILAVLFLKLYFGVDMAYSVLYNEYIVNQGKNLTIPCGEEPNNKSAMWIREGKKSLDFQGIQSDSSLILTDISPNDSGLYICSVLESSNETDTESVYIEYVHVEVNVRTTPGAVSSFRVRASTIIAVLIWEIFKNRTGGYPIIDFTAEMRKIPDYYYYNNTEEDLKWEKLEPHHITPNARYLEVFHLLPNTSYQFRIWANNELGAGDMYTVTSRTIAPTQEKDLILRIMEDAKGFDTRIWIAAVGIVMGTLVILTCGTCIVLYKECKESPVAQDEVDMELVQNMHVILNPGFCENDDRTPLSPIHTNLYPSASFDDDDSYNMEHMTFSRKMSIFFQGNTIKRTI